MSAPDRKAIESALDQRPDSIPSVPQYPSHGTQTARLLASLLEGRQVDPLSGWRRLGIYRLSDTVFRLRGLGWPVQTKRKDVRNRFGESCAVALYDLPGSVIVRAGESARIFIETARGEA